MKSRDEQIQLAKDKGVFGLTYENAIRETDLDDYQAIAPDGTIIGLEKITESWIERIHELTKEM